MTAAESIIARIRICGYDVELSGPNPYLTKRDPAAQPLRDDLLAELKLNRVEIIRHITITKLIARSVGKTIYAYDSKDGRAKPLNPKKGIPWNADRICAEGDQFWLLMPKGKEPAKKRGRGGDKKSGRKKKSLNGQNVHSLPD